MPLQVIGGEARGRRLKSPPAGVRPTAAIVRRSLFDILGYLIEDAVVLDLYAGSGSLGIEALSRGAARADFVDKDRRCCTVIKFNLAAIGETAAGGRGRVDCATAESWLSRRPTNSTQYDIAVIDPPYGEPGVTRVLELLVEAGVLSSDAIVALETRRDQAVDMPDGLTEVRRVHHGDTQLILMRPLG
ncbi:MAG TPA: 16S rRNA (guanine(966)-N(2))-methyltransferase RsmD [Candidatus Dormibacteraeota bacterium]|nr:16S rRNA (guanine(966)-N(2))-methyltransferase RsmD [Candidatus Dormibacteraeota bacterium]